MVSLYENHWSPEFRLRQSKINARVYSFSTTKHLTIIITIMSHLLGSELIIITEKPGPNRKYQKPKIMKILPAIAFIANFGIF
jgi:hypothetical protein